MARRSGFIFVLMSLALPTALWAGPLVIEERAKIPAPDPSYNWPESVAIDGDWLIATGSKDAASDDNPSGRDNSAWLYQRQSDGSWRLIRRLHQFIVAEDGDEPPMIVAMQGGVAAILKENASWIFERSGTNWVAVPSPMNVDGMDVEVNGGTIVASAGHCEWIANAYRKGTTGAWQLVRSTEAESVECENEDDRGDVDVSGSAIIVATFGQLDRPHSARIFEGAFGTPATMTRLVAPEGNPWAFGVPVAIENASALVGGNAASGIHAYTRDPTNYWYYSGSLLRPDSLAIGDPSFSKAKLRGGLAVVGQYVDPMHGLRSGSISVFQRNSNGTFRYVAKLVASDGAPERELGRKIEISGRRVVASSIPAKSIYVFELPTSFSQPATLQDTFEDGNYSGWTPISGSSFAVATTFASKVLRQSSDIYAAAAYLDNMDWRNQAIEADIKPAAFATGGGERWFGLVTRHTDANNYYYVTLRNTNLVQLKKMVNGSYSTLASASLPIVLNRNYRVRLEAVGTRLRVFVDNQLLAQARDTALTHGRAGVYMYKTKADYDNIIVSANAHTTLASYRFDGDDSSPSWELLGDWTTVEEPNFNRVYSQTSLVSGTRAITGISTDDQAIQARVKPTSFAGGDNWFGLTTRYRDSGNYYYVTLRNNNIISLRKLVNGAIFELDRGSLTVAANTWYRLKFDAVGNQLRVYVNGQLRVEATDSTHTTGRYGLIAYKTAAQFDDVLAMQP